MKIRVILLFLCFSVTTISVKAQKTYQVSTQNIYTSDSIISLFMAAAEVDSLLYIEDVCPELDTTGRKPLFLIHGWSFENVPAPPSGGYWNFFREYLRNDPELRANFKPYYVRYWSNYVPVVQIAAELRKKVEEAGFHKKRIAIMAHSMGGLVSRSYMEEQRFTEGPRKGEKCGILVDQLITLGTPHHGSPMANYNARNEFYNWFYKQVIGQVERLAFSDLMYNKVNRSDLRWDNYNGLMNYSKFPDEANPWLLQLNNQSTFHPKITCYSGAINGQFTIPDTENIDEIYSFLAFMQTEGFNYPNDGIVPINSAQFDGHEVEEIRHFSGYNHADINHGKEGQREVLFDFFKIDLNRSKPLKLLQPGVGNKEYLKYNQRFDIVWEAPAHVNKVNLYFSHDNGSSYSEIANNIEAREGSYTWTVPDLNADNCRIKVTDADFEYEYAFSSSSFTVYNNKINFLLTDNSYFVNYRNDTIKWQFEGLICTATVLYHDAKNDTSFILTDNIELQHGQEYSAVLLADTTLQPTDKASIEIQLNEMEERYGDTSAYNFNSEDIQHLGKPDIRLMSPSSLQVGIDQIEGMPYVVDKIVPVIFEAEGEILHFELYACDSVGDVFDTVFVGANKPKILANRIMPWRVPNYRGNNFYYYIKAGVSADSILAENYSDYPFRINYQTEITNPFGGQLDAHLLPCFDVEIFDGASEYAYLLRYANAAETWGKYYTSENSKLCVPNLPYEELTPGKRYHLTAKAKVDNLWTYPDTIIFTSEAVQPYDFNIITPETNDSIEGDSAIVVWQRAVGTEHYKIDLVQGVVVYESDRFEKTDTTAIVDISDLQYYTNTDVIVYAYNQYGQTTAINTIMRKFRTNAEQIDSTRPSELKIKPNPVSNDIKTFIEIKTPQNMPAAELTLYDVAGKRIGKLIPALQPDGIYRVEWQHLTKNKKLQSGTYILQLRTSNEILREKVLVK